MEQAIKTYRCRKCGTQSKQLTNHYGETYSHGCYNVCPKCPPFKRPTVWDCCDKPSVRVVDTPMVKALFDVVNHAQALLVQINKTEFLDELGHKASMLQAAHLLEEALDNVCLEHKNNDTESPTDPKSDS